MVTINQQLFKQGSNKTAAEKWQQLLNKWDKIPTATGAQWQHRWHNTKWQQKEQYQSFDNDK